jgi:multisubunit Na+/H+ antiporter MnhE subunit
MFHYFYVILSLAVIYLLLTADWRFGNIVVALALAAGISAAIRPQIDPIPLQRLPGIVWWLFVYLGVLLKDIALNALWVADIVVRNRPINPGIIAIPSKCETPMGAALSAHAITASPGEMVMEIGDDGVMYVHCLDATNRQELMEAAQTQRRELLQNIFK